MVEGILSELHPETVVSLPALHMIFVNMYLYTDLTTDAASSSSFWSFSFDSFLMSSEKKPIRVLIGYVKIYVPPSCHASGGIALPGLESTIAWAKATTTVRSARPILSFPSSDLMRYLASLFRQDTKSTLILSTFCFCDCNEECRC